MASTSEQKFSSGVAITNVREDGREAYDFRNFSIEVNTIPSVEGSAVVSRQFSNDNVTCAIKLDFITNTKSDNDFSGKVYFSVDLTSLESSSVLTRQAVDHHRQYLEHCFSSVLNSCIDPERTLNLIKGQLALNVFVDCVIESCDGNFVDILSIAVFAALKTCIKPRVELFKSGNFMADKGLTNETEEFDDFQVDPDLSKADKLISEEEFSKLCVSVTFCELSTGSFVADSRLSEEKCALSSTSIFSNAQGEVCGVFMPQMKGGIQVQQLKQVLSDARKLGKQLIKTTEKALESQKL